MLTEHDNSHSRCRAIARIAILCGLILHTAPFAQAQGSKKLIIIVEDAQILDARLESKGITGRSLAETLRLILSGEPDLITELAEPVRKAPDTDRPARADEFRLSSSIRRFQNS